MQQNVVICIRITKKLVWGRKTEREDEKDRGREGGKEEKEDKEKEEVM